MKNIIIKNNDNPPKVVIINQIEDIDTALEQLKENMSIIVNASNVNKKEGLRMIDFLSGYCYACNGIYKKIDEMIYKFEIKR